MINNKTILITGGTGSFGSFLLRHLLKNFNPKKIIIFSRDEQKQFIMEHQLSKFKTKLRFFIGDVRDYKRLEIATKNVDILIHAAAMKHVAIAEYNPFEVFKTNVIGAQNVIDASIANNVGKVLALSTDKASSPINLYGSTKLTSDKLFVAANNYIGKNLTKFSVVRYGNVMNSNGSVVPFFKKESKSGILPITDLSMTRFNITLKESVLFVLGTLSKMVGGEIFVPKIPSYKITDLAKAVSPKAKFKVIGIRPGEKLHEEMIPVGEALNTLEYKNYFVIVPNSRFNKWNKKKYKNFFGGKVCKPQFSYNSYSNSSYLSIQKLKKIISEN